MHILLVYLTQNWHQSGYNYGLGYIASVLKEKGHSVNYITVANDQDTAALYERIRSNDPEITGFYVTTSQFCYAKEIIPVIKNISKSFLVCGGPHPTLQPECILEIPDLDAIVRGEGEYPMLDLVEALEHKTDYLLIKNFWFRTNKGIIRNELRPLISNLDDLPFPDKSSLDYQKEIDRHRGVIRFNMSRGCTYECTYCSNKAFSNIFEKNYFRTLSPQKAIKEIELNAAKYNFKEIIFDDDTINLNEKWFHEFFTLYKTKFKYPFVCNMRPNIINEDAVKLLKEAGVKAIWIGIEHGNEEFRKQILKRDITDKQIIDAVKLINKYKISCFAQVIVGLPFENKKLFLDTVRLCRKLHINNKSISIFFPYPSTELGKICKSNNWLPDKMYYNERDEAAIDFPGFSRKEIQLCSDLFPFLITFKFIPLKTPLNFLNSTIVSPINHLHGIFRKLNKISLMKNQNA